VALLNTQNQLRNRDKSLKVAVDFKNDFFDNLEIKHSLCNETGSEISAAETKAVIKRSQELYKELLNQLQIKLDGTRGTKSTRDGNRPTETPLLLDYYENSY
jgi:hypothetical protein